MSKIRQALELFEALPDDGSGVEPGWMRGMAWGWYGHLLLRGTQQDRELARGAFERALQLEPELQIARAGLESLADSGDAGGG